LRYGPGYRSFCVGGCLLRQKNHLSAAAAPGEMGENLLAFRGGKRLLGEGVQALAVGMKIELGS
jgi:hypothetical protein